MDAIAEIVDDHKPCVGKSVFLVRHSFLAKILSDL